MRISISKTVILSIFLLTGCNSFYQIDNNELPEISNEDVIQIKLENGQKLNFTNIQHITITSNQELEIIRFSSTEYKIDSARTLYPLNEIKEIRVKKLNPQKTIFSSLWITVGVAFAVLLAFSLMGYPITFGPG